jgi:hypothetical protein
MYQQLLTKILGIFDIPSGPIVGLWSIVMLIGCAYSIYYTKQISQPVAIIFSTIIGAFAGHKIVNVWKGSNNQDKNIDVNGDDNDDTDKSSK